MTLILSPEQKALRFVTQRHSEEGQATLFATAIQRACSATADDINEEGAPVNLSAVLNALAGAVGFYLAQAPEEHRGVLMAGLIQSLPHNVALHLEIEGRG